MNDDFLHRLRKAPRPEFAVRLRAQLRRQSMDPLPPKLPSRARTLLTLLLLGGTAFALTAIAMRGLPPSILELYQHAAAWVTAGRTTTSGHPADTDGIVQGLRWDGSGYSPAHGAGLHTGGTTQSAAQAMSSQSAAASAARSSGGPPRPGGVPSGPNVPQIRVVASWSAYPYAATIAEQLRPSITGQIDVSVRDSASWPGPLCGAGADAPDLAYAFEPIGAAINIPCSGEASNNATSVRAVPIGYEAVILARSPLYGALNLTRRQAFLALAKWVPDPSRPGTVHQNPSMTWRQIAATLGPEPIEIMGPPLSSAGGRSMIELLMEAGCDTYPWIAALESSHPDRYARICRTVRTDGVYDEVSNLSPTALLTEPNAIGVFGVDSWTLPLLNALSMSRLDGVVPTLQSMESGAYPGARALYLYDRGRVPRNLLLLLLNAAASVRTPDWALLSPWSMRAAYLQALMH